MASHVVVISTDLRRATVKVLPSTFLTDVLQEACKKLGLSSDKFLLKHNKKQIDLGIPFRASGLSPGAKLELVIRSSSPSPVSVALQLPPLDGSSLPGSRLIQQFPSDLTVWQILRQFESGDATQDKNLNLTARGVARTSSPGQTNSGQIFYQTPSLNIMGRELSTFADFQKTLSQLGYNSGSVLIRLSFKETDKPLAKVMDQISEFFADEEVNRHLDLSQSEELATEPQGSSREPEAAVAAPPEQIAAADMREASHSDSGNVSEQRVADPPAQADPLRPESVFLAPSSSTPSAAQIQDSDEDFTPSVSHAQLHQSRLQAGAQNRRLLSNQELEEQAVAHDAKLAAVTSVAVRVRFPDNTMAQWRFGLDDVGAVLYQAVRSVMVDNHRPFKLVAAGDKTIIRDGKDVGDTLIRGHKLSGGVLVNLVWDESVSAYARQGVFLKTDVTARAQVMEVPVVPPHGSEPEVVQTAASSSTGDAVTVVQKLGKAGAKVPKWFMKGKK